MSAEERIEHTPWGPGLSYEDTFLKWPRGMELRFARLGLAEFLRQVIRELASWSGFSDRAQPHIVWCSNDTIARRIGHPGQGSRVGRALRDLCEPQAAKAAQGRIGCKGTRRPATPGRPALLELVEAATWNRAARYSLLPLWSALESIDITDEFPNGRTRS